jgi:anthranilate synthase component 1
MSVQPDFQTFQSVYAQNKTQLLWRTVVADLETPVSTFLKLGQDEPFSFLLESVEGGAHRGRYSVIGLKPDLVWKAVGNMAWINDNPLNAPDDYSPCPVAEKSGALDSLRAIIAQSEVEIPSCLPPMSAGLVGYMSYDTIRLVERLPDTNPDTLGIPDGVYVRPTVLVMFDNVNGTLTAVTPVRPGASDAKTQWDLATMRLDEVMDALDKPVPHSGEWIERSEHMPTPVHSTSPEEYAAKVKKAQEYIAAGDIFQVVLSQRFSVPFKLRPFSLYRALRRSNPSPFLFYLNFGAFQLVGSSPEILVRLRDGKVTIRPIAGTRRRGIDATEDQELAADLLADPKELSEHLMLLDLGRNDVGRVAEIGSVTVTSKMQVEYYSHVMHIVSNVEGKLRPGNDAMDALMAGFPAGTVSGAPKIRAMEIIDELETERRSFYAGCIGYFAGNGNMDTCIALRTALIKDGVMTVQAGAGIVMDSVPQSEHEECLNKAKALMRAAEDAISYTSLSNRRAG